MVSESLQNNGEANIPSSNEVKKRLCCADLRVILNYLIAETQKKLTGFRIGIFTVFMVVTFIVMLKSVIQITPILFVKLGQQEAGAIDFQIISSQSKYLIDANVNFYAVDPFSNDPFTTYTNTHSTDLLNQAALYGADLIDSYQDHIEVSVNGMQVSLLKFEYFNNRLKELGGFEGFTPRSIWPEVIIGANGLNSTNLLLIIDSAKEV